MIELINLHIGYSQLKHPSIIEGSVFGNLSATFNKGELIGLVGNNGIGKSTLIKTIFGSLKAIKGEILLDSKNMNAFSLQELSKLISIVLTDKIGGFNLTVYDVVASGRIPYLNAFAQLQAEDKQIIERSLEQMGITNLQTKLMDELSDGQKQKVIIAKSLAQQTPVILLDEPTAFLDYTSKQQLFSILKQLCKEQNKTIIVSSHDLEILFKNADKILYLKEDRAYEFDKAESVKNNFGG